VRGVAKEFVSSTKILKKKRPGLANKKEESKTKGAASSLTSVIDVQENRSGGRKKETLQRETVYTPRNGPERQQPRGCRGRVVLGNLLLQGGKPLRRKGSAVWGSPGEKTGGKKEKTVVFGKALYGVEGQIMHEEKGSTKRGRTAFPPTRNSRKGRRGNGTFWGVFRPSGEKRGPAERRKEGTRLNAGRTDYSSKGVRRIFRTWKEEKETSSRGNRGHPLTQTGGKTKI